ncbi:hypothetical protein BKA66DRAFT_439540 [Pyrenochaeta sp. MPI-SDFR-AT-0127]|nr:hypothetical protein BKA66DRAFT_439540 [Pyrenochaeta sp. MPI-SDFR-AT-0127]
MLQHTSAEKIVDAATNAVHCRIYVLFNRLVRRCKLQATKAEDAQSQLHDPRRRTMDDYQDQIDLVHITTKDDIHARRQLKLNSSGGIQQKHNVCFQPDESPPFPSKKCFVMRSPPQKLRSDPTFTIPRVEAHNHFIIDGGLVVARRFVSPDVHKLDVGKEFVIDAGIVYKM